MKLTNIFKGIAVLLLVMAIRGQAHAQCDETLLEKGIELIDNFQYLKDFRIKMKKAKKNKPIPYMKYSVMLSRGTKYRIVGFNADEYPGKIVYQLYDKTGLIASSYDPNTGLHYGALDFTCARTGIYYLVMSFKGGEEGCGMCILSFQNRKRL